MIYYAKGSAQGWLTEDELREGLYSALGQLGSPERVLAIPPDFTRFHSHAGPLTRMAYEYYGQRLTDVLPALGTHYAMEDREIEIMYAGVPRHLFRVHNWKSDLVTLGTVPAEYIAEVSEGKVSYPWPAQVNKLLTDGGHELILSIGQVVPHEVVGFANQSKNIFVGTGGREGINKSHYLGAVYGMERMMGRADTPVRKVLNYAARHFASRLPIVYVLTVVGKTDSGKTCVKGLFIGDDYDAFELAAALSFQVNFEMLEQPLQKVVVYLDPEEFKSTWLGNKSIYRTRMAIADGGELIVLAPGLKTFGEDKEVDRLIRKYGYVTTPEVLAHVAANEELQQNLSAAAHLIHGSSEGRFTITYCPGSLSKEEIEGANFRYGSLAAMMQRYNPALLKEGMNVLPGGEEVFYVSNPALGLWASRGKFTA